MMNNEQIESLKSAKPILEKSVKECSGNSELAAIKDTAELILKKINRCELFDIWNESATIEYGVYCGNIDEIPFCGEYKGNEELLVISFPTGAYIFGKRYDQDYFKEFFCELQCVPAQYIDPVNKALYYKPQNARKAYEHYRSTLKKYMDGNRERAKRYEIERLKKQLKELEENYVLSTRTTD